MAFPTNRAGTTGYPEAKTRIPNLSLAPCAKINSKWIMAFNKKGKTIKVLWGEKGEYLET